MKTVTFIQNVQAIALAQAATIKVDRVCWGHGNYVSFRNQGGRVVIKTVYCDYDLSVIMYNDSVGDLGGEKINMVMAAMIALNRSSVMVGNEILIMAVNAGPEVVVIRETRRPATNWETAAGFTLSQNRPEREERPRRQTTTIHYETNVPPITLPKTKLGWAALGLAAVAVVGLSVAAASVSEQ